MTDKSDHYSKATQELLSKTRP